MNSDLVLRARLVQQGYSDEDIVKFLGMSKLPGGGITSYASNCWGNVASEENWNVKG